MISGLGLNEIFRIRENQDQDQLISIARTFDVQNGYVHKSAWHRFGPAFLNTLPICAILSEIDLLHRMSQTLPSKCLRKLSLVFFSFSVQNIL